MIFLARLIAFLLGQLAGLGALLLWTALALLFWLATTQSGLRMVAQTLESAGLAQVGRAEGSLFGRMRLGDVVVHAGSTTLKVKCAELDWQPLDLMQRRVQVNTLWLSGVRVELAPETETKEETASAPWEGLEPAVCAVCG